MKELEPSGYASSIIDNLRSKPVALIALTGALFVANNEQLAHANLDDINTVTNGRTEKQIINYCDQNGPIGPSNGSSGYVGESHEKYRLKFIVASVNGCRDYGTRKVSYFQEKKEGDEDSFSRNSSINTVVRNRQINVNSTLNAPFSCDNGKFMVRRAVRVTWTPKKGEDKTPIVRTYKGKAKNVC